MTGEDEADMIDRKARALEDARRRKGDSAWRGVAMFGMVGWAVAVPVIAGIAIGTWIDRTWPGRPSWTLILLVVGAMIGGLNAWYWVQREGRDD